MNRQDFAQSLVGKRIIGVYQYNGYIDYVFSERLTVRLYGTVEGNPKEIKFHVASWVDNSNPIKSVLHFAQSLYSIEFISDVEYAQKQGEFFITSDGQIVSA
jgi:hypothetical protein